MSLPDPRMMLLLCCLVSWPAFAHEVRPAFLQFVETEPGQFDVLWKQPIVQDRRLPLEPVLPEDCVTLTEPRPSAAGGALLQAWTVSCALDGGRIHIDGLARTLTDVLVEVRRLDAEPLNVLLRPSTPSLDLAAPHPGALGYLSLGVSHLLLGIDHVLFVIGLVYLIPGRWMLLKTITAFTVAHSLTLAASVLGWVQLSQAPVEAVIALSILFLARELLMPPERRSRLTHARPWVVAGAFGLLHGFGFAGALAEIGLPRDTLALALLLFNLGIEAGQLVLIAAMLLLFQGTRLLARASVPAWLLPAAASGRASPAPFDQILIYAMGSLAAFWMLDRSLAML